MRNDGAFEIGRQLSWAWEQIIEDSKDALVRAQLQQEKLTDWYSALPLRKGLSPLSAAPNYEAYYLDEATHADDGAYWHSISMNWQLFYTQTSDIPMQHIGAGMTSICAARSKTRAHCPHARKRPSGF